MSEAISAGALETAEQLFELLLPHAGMRLEVESLISLLDGALLLGRRDELGELADRRRRELRQSVRGATLLTLFDLCGPSWLPNGQPNFVAWSRGVSRGDVTADDLAQLSNRAGARWLFSPELQLPFFSALWSNEPERALRFLNRYLALSGSEEQLSLRDAGHADALGCLRCAAGARSVGPLVSVVLAARNAESCLSYAIESLLTQSYERLELLVGDDASTDRTAAIMARYGSHRGVRLFRSAQQQGAYNLRNALARHASGELLTFHDADDFALSRRIEHQVERLLRQRAQGVVTSLLRMSPEGAVVFFKNQRATRLSRVSLMLRRKAFESVGPFRCARVGADEELQARVHERFGADAIARIALPHNLCLWSSASATRTLGCESLEDGYRSPSRRAYSELIYRRFVARDAVTDAEFDARLRETGNYVLPSEIVELPG